MRGPRGRKGEGFFSPLGRSRAFPLTTAFAVPTFTAHPQPERGAIDPFWSKDSGLRRTGAAATPPLTRNSTTCFHSDRRDPTHMRVA